MPLREVLVTALSCIKVKFSLILTVMYYINMYFVTRILSLKAKFSLILVAIKVKFEFGTLRPVAFSCCHYCVQFVYANLEILSNLFIQYWNYHLWQNNWKAALFCCLIRHEILQYVTSIHIKLFILVRMSEMEVAV